MEVVITNKIPTETIREIKEQLPSVTITQFETMSEAKETLESADALFLFGGGLTEHVISSAVNLKWVMTSSAGVETCRWTHLRNEELLLRMQEVFIMCRWESTPFMRCLIMHVNIR